MTHSRHSVLFYTSTMKHLVKLIDINFEVPEHAWKEKNVNVNSSQFPICYQGGTSTWRLEFCFNGETIYSEKFVSFTIRHKFTPDRGTGSVGTYLKLVDGEMRNDVQFNIYLRGHEAETMKIVTFTREQKQQENADSPIRSWFLSLNDIVKLNLGKKFHVKCEIYFANIHHITKAATCVEIPDGKCLELLIFHQPEVTIATNDGMKFRGNRDFLSKKSPVFKSMFDEIEADKGETQNEIIEIKQFSGKVIMELLRFIFLAKVHDIDSINVDLYNAAKLYEIESLPALCLKSIVKCVNPENVIELVKFAVDEEFNELFLKCCEVIHL